jgi:hypothetical protein
MDIDLLLTANGEAGLITSQNQAKKVVGALFDGQTGLMSLEYADMDHLEFNIPIDQGFWAALDMNQLIHLGAVKNGNIAQAVQVPLMFLDDPYRGEVLGRGDTIRQPLAAFNGFIRRCVTGQPVHRENLDDDQTAICILGDASPAALQFAPHLARQHALEVRPTAAPSMPGYSMPGLGGSTSGGGNSTTYRGGGNFGDDDEGE